MLEQATLEALRDGYWYVYPLVMLAGVVAFLRGSSLALGRSLLALSLGSVAMSGLVGLSGGQSLTWWQHLLIDVPVLVIITMPPRHYWQATLGGLVFAQIVLHVFWGVPQLLDLAGPLDWAREHWLGNILFGYAKCVVVLLWAGGSRVQAVLDRAADLASQVLLAPLVGKRA